MMLQLLLVFLFLCRLLSSLLTSLLSTTILVCGHRVEEMLAHAPTNCGSSKEVSDNACAKIIHTSTVHAGNRVMQHLGLQKRRHMPEICFSSTCATKCQRFAAALILCDTSCSQLNASSKHMPNPRVDVDLPSYWLEALVECGGGNLASCCARITCFSLGQQHAP